MTLRSRRTKTRLVRPVRARRACRSVLEYLESRINLSASGALAAIDSPPQPAHHARTSHALHTAVDTTTLLGDTWVAAGTTTVPITDYAAISGARLEYRDGSSAPDIGYMATSGVAIDYKLNVASAGSYKLSLGVASMGTSAFNVYVNGSQAAQSVFSPTGGWSSYSSTSQTLSLPAGSSTLRIVPIWGSQFNINAITLAPSSSAGATPAPAQSPAPAPSSTTGASTLGSSLTVSPDHYSAISGSQLEWINGKPDIGYVSPSGATVDYALNVQTAGTYTFTVNAAAKTWATFDLLVNGQQAANFVSNTGSWSTFQPTSASVYLPAGQVTLRFASKWGTQYNLGSFTISSASQIAPAPAAPSAPPAPAWQPPAPSAPQTSNSSPVSISSSWMTSFNQLNVTGTSGNDSIYVSQSGDTLSINANGQTSTYSASQYGNLVIKGADGNDSITVDPSVKIDTLIYGGNGNNTLKNATQGYGTIVALGNGFDSLTGNGWNTSFWADSSDQVNASSAETSGGHVHQISSFWGGTTTQLAGQNLPDPAGSGSTTRLVNSSLWGKGPSMSDVAQGSVDDCYFLGALQTLAGYAPAKLREMAVDLGDGTYAVQFKRGGISQYVRVDGDLPAGGYWSNGLMYAHPGASGNQWVEIMEKAYAEFRTSSWSYSSLTWGNFNAVLGDLGVPVSALGGYDANSLFANIQSDLAAGRGVTVGTFATVNAGAPLIQNHTYTVTAAWKDAWGNAYLTLRNPWGFDGAGSDSNTTDGLVTLSAAQLQANMQLNSVLA